MSLEAEFRRDINPTPTRFLLECGALTPGLSLNLENYNPFDASLKYLNTGTPKVEFNPFDTSFKAPPAISVKTSNLHTMPTYVAGGLVQENERQRSSLRYPWTDMMLDEAEVSMSKPQSSPGLSSLSASPSPPVRTPPLPTITLDPMSTQHQPYPAFQTYNHELVFEKLYHSQVAGGAGDTTTCPIRETLAPSEILTGPLEGYRPDNSEDDDESVDQHDVEERHSVHDQELIDQYDDSGMDVAMSGLAMRRQSEMSDIEPAALGRLSQHDTIYYHKDDQDDGDDESYIPMANKTRSRSKKTAGAETDSANLTTKASSGASTSSRKAKGSAITKAGSRKRTSAEDESPEAKRQRFLERNRLAASKCREKKRLQTLKTISDADEITARNQALHETLDQLQEEVRQLKNQILCHRDCGCDVIQKFVKSSFGMGSLSSSCSSPTSPTSATEMTATMPPRLPMY